MGDKTVESTGPKIDQDKSVGAAGINENMLLTELDKDGFYSQLLAKAKDLSPRLNTANVKATLLNMGVKEDEMRWVGIDDFLEQKLANNNGQDVSFDKLELITRNSKKLISLNEVNKLHVNLKTKVKKDLRLIT